ncbi:MAG: LysM peptidoglycan-binding domain-containing protein, partial [Pseudomonadota bacterium]
QWRATRSGLGRADSPAAAPRNSGRATLLPERNISRLVAAQAERNPALGVIEIAALRLPTRKGALSDRSDTRIGQSLSRAQNLSAAAQRNDASLSVASLPLPSRQTIRRAAPARALNKPSTAARTRPAARDDARSEVASRRAKRSGRIYVVRRGDTLWKIARRYYGSGAAFPRILAANNLTKSARLSIDQRIRVPLN